MIYAHEGDCLPFLPPSHGVEIPVGAFFKTSSLNSHGNRQDHYFWMEGERYFFDFGQMSEANGWIQYDTDQDASYFGVWVNVNDRKTVTYAEGDIYVTTCPSLDSFRDEIAAMNEFHGAPPHFATVIDLEGKVTRYVDVNARPKV